MKIEMNPMNFASKRTKEKGISDKLFQIISDEYRKLWGESDERYLLKLFEMYTNLNDDMTGNVNRLQQVIGSLKGKRILDFGCGYGSFLIYCLKRGYDVTGVDISRQRLEFFSVIFELSGLPEFLRSRYIIYDGRNLPFSDNSFDVVVANQVLEHVRRVREVIAELGRVLKKGGILYTRSPDYSRSFYEPHYRVLWFPFIRGSMARAYLRVLRRPPDGLEHINFLGKRELVRLLRENGFSVLMDMEKKIVFEDRKMKFKKLFAFLPCAAADFLNTAYEIIRQLRMIGREENQIDVMFQKA